MQRSDCWTSRLPVSVVIHLAIRGCCQVDAVKLITPQSWSGNGFRQFCRKVVLENWVSPLCW